jgi:Flp pilus assembly pilin Flp
MGRHWIATLALRHPENDVAVTLALIASLIAVAIIGAVTTVGTNLSTVFTEVGNTLK